MKGNLRTGTLVAVSLAAALLIAGSASRTPGTSVTVPAYADTRSELERLVRSRTVAWFVGDADAYARYTAENFLWNGAPARPPKRVTFPDTRPFEITNFHVVESRDAAVVSYILTEYLNYEEGAPFDRRQRTEKWIRHEGQWKVVAAESSEACTSNSGRWLCY
jgi:hypothetical protein